MPDGELPSIRTIQQALEERRRRRDELAEQISRIQARLAAMTGEVEELETALRVLRVLTQGASLALPRRPGRRPRRRRGQPTRLIEGCVAALQQHDGMADAAEVARYLKEQNITKGDKLTSSYVTAVRTMRRHPEQFEESRVGRHLRFRLKS